MPNITNKRYDEFIAQAETLERVRAAAESQPFCDLRLAIRAALGPAPAQAEPVLRQRGKSVFPEVVALRERAEAAEARCAELARRESEK